MDITTIQDKNTVTIVITAKQAGDFINLLTRIADGMDKLAINAAPAPMLPATPLQHLITRAFDGLLVMTSGNVHDDPIVIEEHEDFLLQR